MKWYHTFLQPLIIQGPYYQCTRRPNKNELIGPFEDILILIRQEKETAMVKINCSCKNRLLKASFQSMKIYLASVNP